MRRSLSAAALPWAGAWAFAVTLAAAAGAARAAACPLGPSGWVLLDAGGGPRGYAESLAEELSPRGVSVCTEARQEGPGALAHVILAASPPAAAATFVIEVDDRITRKRVTRAVDLRHLDRATRAFALAVATDELLAAAWAELALRPPEVDAPARILRTQIADAIGHAAPAARVDLSFVAVVEAASSSAPPAAGFDLRVGYELSPRFHPFVGGGGRAFRTIDAPDGTVTARAAALSLGARVPLWRPTASYAVALVGAFRSDLIWLHGASRPGAAGYDARVFGSRLTGGLGVARSTGRWVLAVEALAGHELLAPEARDGDEVFPLSRGVLLHVALAIGVRS